MQTQINPVALKFLGLSIHWYAIFIVIGAMLAAFSANREAIKQGFGDEVVLDFILWALPLGILGARLYYVLFQLPYYVGHPAEIFEIWNGGLAIYGGLLAGLGYFIYFTRKRGLSFWKFLDICLPCVLVGQAFGRWGNFINQEAYGQIVSREFLAQTLHLPRFIVENMYIQGAYHQPTFLYESLWCFLGFGLLMFLRNRANFLKIGQLSALELMWYSFERFFVEGMRTDSLLFLNLRISQLLSAILFVIGGVLFVWHHKRADNVFYLSKE